MATAARTVSHRLCLPNCRVGAVQPQRTTLGYNSGLGAWRAADPAPDTSNHQKSLAPGAIGSKSNYCRTRSKEASPKPVVIEAADNCCAFRCCLADAKGMSYQEPRRLPRPITELVQASASRTTRTQLREATENLEGPKDKRVAHLNLSEDPVASYLSIKNGTQASHDIADFGDTDSNATTDSIGLAGPSASSTDGPYFRTPPRNEIRRVRPSPATGTQPAEAFSKPPARNGNGNGTPTNLRPHDSPPPAPPELSLPMPEAAAGGGSFSNQGFNVPHEAKSLSSDLPSQVWGNAAIPGNREDSPSSTSGTSSMGSVKNTPAPSSSRQVSKADYAQTFNRNASPTEHEKPLTNRMIPETSYCGSRRTRLPLRPLSPVQLAHSRSPVRTPPGSTAGTTRRLTGARRPFFPSPHESHRSSKQTPVDNHASSTEAGPPGASPSRLSESVASAATNRSRGSQCSRYGIRPGNSPIPPLFRAAPTMSTWALNFLPGHQVLGGPFDGKATPSYPRHNRVIHKQFSGSNGGSRHGGSQELSDPSHNLHGPDESQQGGEGRSTGNLSIQTRAPAEGPSQERDSALSPKLPKASKLGRGSTANFGYLPSNVSSTRLGSGPRYFDRPPLGHGPPRRTNGSNTESATGPTPPAAKHAKFMESMHTTEDSMSSSAAPPPLRAAVRGRLGS